MKRQQGTDPTRAEAPAEPAPPSVVDELTAYARLDAPALFERLGTSPDLGLDEAEARSRLRRYGANALPEPRERGFARLFLDQLREPLVLILLAAALLSALLREWVDTAVIAVVVLLNGLIGASQEQSAAAALAALRRMTAPTARVCRAGRLRTVPSSQLVPGDLIHVEAGDRVPADARLIEATALRVNEAPLTGESLPVEKQAAPLTGPPPEGVGDLVNLLFSGTTLTYGNGRAVVVATGSRTAFGRLAGLVAREPEERTPLQRRMAEVGRTLGAAAGFLVALVLAAGLLRGLGWLEMLLTAVSLAVAAIPEGLPAVVTVVLALGVRRMAERNAIVRRLAAVETLGTATVIVSDKTGTLTQNRMTVQQLLVPDPEGRPAGVHRRESERLGHPLSPGEEALREPVRRLLSAACLASDARLERGEDGMPEVVGDPTEGALLLAAAENGLDPARLLSRWPREGALPFDSDRKRMTTLHRDPEGGWRTLTKGAPDLLLPLCDRIRTPSGLLPLDEPERARWLEANRRLARQALRVLAVAERVWSHSPGPMEAEQVERGLVFLGLVGMADPLRPEARESVRLAQRAGIRTLLVTGDHAATAAAISRQLGLLEEEPARSGRAETALSRGGTGSGLLTGREVEELDDDALAEAVGRVRVYARVSPEHKLRIVRALQARGEVVAVTGDGVNDAPALRGADIGCAMGRTGTDVAREASDMVLVDDNYATIVEAVRQGRVIYANIRKSIYYLLSCNVGEITAIFLAILFGLGSPLTPVQILWLNLVTDSLPALALGMEPPEPDVMDRPPRDPRESLFAGSMAPLLLVQGVGLGLLALGVFAWGHATGSVERAESLAFATLAFGQLVQSFNARSIEQSLFRLAPLANRSLLGAVGLSALLGLAILLQPWLRWLFGTAALSPGDWAVVLLALVLVLLLGEGGKAVLRAVRALRGGAG
ncbi:MAG: cation-transporting P-type ATPase [Bacillota bacterium]|nr:cation-transporting P-type ATPase [Bacillota bacterium]